MPLEIKKNEVINPIWSELQDNLTEVTARRTRAQAISAENEFSNQDFNSAGVLNQGLDKPRGKIHDADEKEKHIKAQAEAQIIESTNNLENLLKTTLPLINENLQLKVLEEGMQKYGKPDTWWEQLKDKRAAVIAKQKELARAMYSSDTSLNPWDRVPSIYFKDIDKNKSKQQQNSAARLKWITAAKQALATAENDALETRNAFFKKLDANNHQVLLSAEENLVQANQRLATLQPTPAEKAQSEKLVGSQLSSGASVLLLNLEANTRAAIIEIMIQKKTAELEVLNQEEKNLAKKNDKSIILKLIRTPKPKTTKAQIDLKNVINGLEKLKSNELQVNSQVININLKDKIKALLESETLYTKLEQNFKPAALFPTPKNREQIQQNNEILANTAKQYSTIISTQVTESVANIVSSKNNDAIKQSAGDAFVGSLTSRTEKYRGERNAKVSDNERAYKGQSRENAATVTANVHNIVDLNVRLYSLKDDKLEQEFLQKFPQALAYLYTELFIKRTDIGTIKEVNDPKQGKYYIVQLKEKDKTGETTDPTTFVLKLKNKNENENENEVVTLTTANGKKVKQSITPLSEVLIAALASTNPKTFNLPNSGNKQISDDKSIKAPHDLVIAEQCVDFLNTFAGSKIISEHDNGVKIFMERLKQKPPAPIYTKLFTQKEIDLKRIYTLDESAKLELKKCFDNFCIDTPDINKKLLWENLNKENMIDALAKFIVKNSSSHSLGDIFYSATAYANHLQDKIQTINATNTSGANQYNKGLNKIIKEINETNERTYSI